MNAILIESLLRRELDTFSLCMQDAGIDHLYFKGTALGYTLYASPAQRARLDTDILIRPADKEHVEQILRQRGFDSEPASGEDEITYQKAFIKQTEWSRIVIDLHWQISNRSLFRDLISFDEALALALPAPRLGSAALVFGHIHALLISVVHPYMHHHGEQDPIWAADQCLIAHQLSAKEWQEFLALAEGKKVLRLTLNQLNYLSDKHHLALPNLVTEKIAARNRLKERSWAYADGNPSLIRQWLLDLIYAPSQRARLRQIKGTLIPEGRYMLHKYGLPDSWNCRLLLPLLHFHRVVRGLVRR